MKRAILLGTTVAFGVLLGMAGTRSIRAGVSHWRIVEYMRTHEVRKLQLGAGGAVGFPDWLNTDIEPDQGEAYLDASKPFPLPDRSFTYIFSEHLIEHLSYQDGLAMLRECHRTLKPGGKVRIATPNLLKLIQLFSEPKSEEVRKYVEAKTAESYKASLGIPQIVSPECAILNYELTNFGHRFLYNPQTLRQSLERAGFSSIRDAVPGVSDDPQLSGLEMRHKFPNHAMNDFETMVFEAVR